MTKKKFLKELEEKLKVLDDKERKDIIEEYSGMIDEKINSGKTEKEVISEYDIDELSKEILEAYKINPNYSKEASSETKKIMNDFENGISNLAKKLGNDTKKICGSFKKENGEFNIDMLFEIIIKAILLLFGLLVLRIPFEIISSLGKELFDVFMYPLNNILGVSWQILIGLIYFACVVLIIITIFKKYFYLGDNKEEKINKSESNKKEVKKENLKQIDEEKIEEKYEKNSGHRTVIQLILTLIFLLPIWCINFGIITGIAVIIYLIIKGIELWGALILLVGISFLFGFIADLINSLIYQKKVHFFPFLVSSILITIGSLMFVEMTLSYNFNDTLENSNLAKEQIYHEQIEENTFINTKEYIKDIIIDDSLENGTVIIKVSYNDIYRIEKEKNNNIINFDFHYSNNKKEIFNSIIADLKDKNIYNYSEIDEISIIIYVNSETRNLIS